jgi:hypothetical protein
VLVQVAAARRFIDSAFAATTRSRPDDPLDQPLAQGLSSA